MQYIFLYAYLIKDDRQGFRVEFFIRLCMFKSELLQLMIKTS